MSKRFKKFVGNYIITALVLGAVLLIYEQVGPLIAGEYFNLIWWGIIGVSAVILIFIGWRLWTGIQSRHLLFDDPND